MNFFFWCDSFLTGFLILYIKGTQIKVSKKEKKKKRIKCSPLPYSLPSGSSANPTARHGVPSFCHQTRKKSPSTLIFPSGSSDSPTPTSVRSARVWWMGGWWWWWAYFWIMFWQISKLFGSYFIMFGHWFWN